jgi:titin
MPVSYALHPSMHMSTDMPTGITAMADSDTAVTVSWTAPTDVGGNTIAKYRVMWKMSSAADYADADMAMTADAMAMSHQVTGLTRGMDYTFKVVALDTDDMAIGAYSMEAPATTHDVPGMPMNVMAAATSDTMITVTWEAPASNGGSDITGYMVQSKYGDGEWMDVDPHAHERHGCRNQRHHDYRDLGSARQ